GPGRSPRSHSCAIATSSLILDSMPSRAQICHSLPGQPRGCLHRERTRTCDPEAFSMRSKQLSSAILVSTLALGLGTPVMAGGLLHHHPWHHKRYVAVPVVVEPAPVVRYRVTERIIIREVTPG